MFRKYLLISFVLLGLLLSLSGYTTRQGNLENIQDIQQEAELMIFWDDESSLWH